jgi:hypothetical protein
MDEALEKMMFKDDNDTYLANGFGGYIKYLGELGRSMNGEYCILQPSVLLASDKVKSTYQTHMDAMCAKIFKHERYHDKVLVEPSPAPVIKGHTGPCGLELGSPIGLYTRNDCLPKVQTSPDSHDDDESVKKDEALVRAIGEKRKRAAQESATDRVNNPADGNEQPAAPKKVKTEPGTTPVSNSSNRTSIDAA